MSAKTMRKLMENVSGMTMAPDDMASDDMAPDDMAPMPMGDDFQPEGQSMELEVIDELQDKFKSIAAEYFQDGGPLDEAGLTDVREKMGKFVVSILDLLHDGWVENMMDGGSSEEDSDDFDFGKKYDDFNKSEDNDKDDDSDEDDSDDDDSDDKDDSDDDDKDDDSDDSDDKEDKDSNNPFEYN